MSFHDIISGYMGHQTFARSFFASHYISYDKGPLGVFYSLCAVLIALGVAVFIFNLYSSEDADSIHYRRGSICLVVVASILFCGTQDKSFLYTEHSMQAYNELQRARYISDIDGCYENVCALFPRYVYNMPPVSWRSPSIWKDVKSNKRMMTLSPLHPEDTLPSAVEDEFYPIRLISAVQEKGQVYVFMKIYSDFELANKDIDGHIFRMSLPGFIALASFSNKNMAGTLLDRPEDIQRTFENSTGRKSNP